MNGPKVLIIDDNPVVLKAFSMMLVKNGFEIATAADGPAAIGQVRRFQPEVILLDLAFPPDADHNVQWDGFVLLDWLRRLETSKNIPVIVITGGDPARYKERALASGAVHFFQKPVDNDALVRTIRDTLNRPKPADSQQNSPA